MIIQGQHHAQACGVRLGWSGACGVMEMRQIGEGTNGWCGVDELCGGDELKVYVCLLFQAGGSWWFQGGMDPG